MLKSIDKLEKYIAKYDKFILSTHESPDGDGLGSVVAFQELLQKLGKKSYILNSDPTPDNFLFIDDDKEINVYTDDYVLFDDINEYAQFVLDTNDYDNIGYVYHLLKDKVVDSFIIDHHVGGAVQEKDNLMKIEMSSVCEIIINIYKHFKIEMSFKAAQAIYAGMLFDTGSFKYPKTTEDTFRAAALCVEKGVVPYYVYQQIFEQNSLSGFELRGKILSSMEIFENGKFILMKLTPEMVMETEASFAEGETSINMPLTVKGVVLSVLVKQNVDGPVKISMRSKGDLNVAEIAMDNGGGGHKNAAGFKSKLSFNETVTYISKLLIKKFFKK